MDHQIQNGRAFKVLRVVYALCLIGLFFEGFNARLAFAQIDQGAIIGVVQDSSGAVIPNADVTLTNLDNGLVLKTKSNGDGNYFFAPIKIGNYTVSASAANFETTVEQN